VHTVLRIKDKTFGNPDWEMGKSSTRITAAIQRTHRENKNIQTPPTEHHQQLTKHKRKGYIDHFTRCKQHWSRSTSCFSFL